MFQPRHPNNLFIIGERHRAAGLFQFLRLSIFPAVNSVSSTLSDHSSSFVHDSCIQITKLNELNKPLWSCRSERASGAELGRKFQTGPPVLDLVPAAGGGQLHQLQGERQTGPTGGREEGLVQRAEAAGLRRRCQGR